jgi:hypothetical protein
MIYQLKRRLGTTDGAAMTCRGRGTPWHVLLDAAHDCDVAGRLVAKHLGTPETRELASSFGLQ